MFSIPSVNKRAWNSNNHTQTVTWRKGWQTATIIYTHLAHVGIQKWSCTSHGIDEYGQNSCATVWADNRKMYSSDKKTWQWSEARFVRSRRQHHKRTVRETSTQWNQSTSSCSSIHDYSQWTKWALMYWYDTIHRPYYTPFTWTHSWSGLCYWELIC